MEVLVSGEAGIAAVMGGKVQIRELGKEPRKAGSPGSALALFAGCEDVIRHEVRNVAEADDVLREAYSIDRAFRLLAIACDSDTLEEDLFHLRSLISKLLTTPSVLVAFERRIAAAPVPESDLRRFRDLSVGTDPLASALRAALELQDEIAGIRARWLKLDPSLFDDESHRRRIWSELVVSGSISEWALSLQQRSDTKFLYLSFASRHRRLKNIDTILRSLLEHQPGAKAASRVRSQVADEDDWTDQFAGEYGNDHAAYENALSQQRAIADKIRLKDFGAARSYVEDLVRQQMVSSGPARTAKSLCRLAQIAKQEAAPDFQLELAYQACEIYPDDPQSHGHLADALIGFGRFADAENAISALELLGNRLFGATQRARILRLRGQWADARQLYLSTGRQFDEERGVEHAWAGAAETLRDMGRVADAIAEYRGLVERWPNEVTLRTGLASALMEAGQFDEALVVFGRSASEDKSPIPLNGRATVYKMSGDLAKAEAAYREIAARFPSDAATSCGLADVMRLRGKLEESMTLYEQARVRAPQSHIPILGIADVLRDQGRFEEAIQLLNSQPEEIGRHVQTQLSMATTLRQMGRFHDALLALDEAIHNNPHYVPGILAKGELLKRVGRFHAAVQLFDRVVASGSMVNTAGAGLAACFIAMGDLDRAERLLPEVQPKTQSDWQKYLVRGSLLNERGASRAALRHLERGVSRCPFARLKNLMSNLMASIHLQRQDQRAALRAAVRVPGEASNVVYLHALAANHRTGQARQVLREDPWQPDVLRLGHGLARLYDFDGDGPAPDKKLVLRNEQTLLLLAA